MQSRNNLHDENNQALKAKGIFDKNIETEYRLLFNSKEGPDEDPN